MNENGISDPGDFVSRCHLMKSQALEGSSEFTSMYSHTPHELTRLPASAFNPHADWDYEKPSGQYGAMILSFLFQRRLHLYAKPNNSTQFALMCEPPLPPYQLPEAQQPPPEQVGAPVPAAAPIQNFAMGQEGPALNPPPGLNQTRHSAPQEPDAQVPLMLNQAVQAIPETIAHPASPSPSTPDRRCKVLYNTSY